MDNEPQSRPSPRVQLAALARAAALGTSGVVTLDEGLAGLFVTASSGERVGGVRCLAAPEGGYDLSLRLACELVALPPLAERVRSAVRRTAAAAGFVVQSVTIEIADVVDPLDPALAGGS